MQGAGAGALLTRALRWLFFSIQRSLLAHGGVHPPFNPPLQGEVGGDGVSLVVILAQAGIHLDIGLFLEVQSFVSPAASRLLFGIAQKVTKKARHRAQCFAAHRARQNPLCFSPAPACSDSTSMYCFASAAIHRRAPAGIFRRGLRCSALRTAPLIHESVHPCTASRFRSGKPALARALALAVASAAGCRPTGGP
jgi:hypothetical protein